MLPTPYFFEMRAKERQENLLAEARQARLAAAASPREAAGRRPHCAPVLDTLGRLLVDVGESLQRAAGTGR